MNLALWIVQGLLAFAMVAGGGFKVVTPRLKLVEKIPWTKTWSGPGCAVRLRGGGPLRARAVRRLREARLEAA
jgi:hypothetical protein